MPTPDRPYRKNRRARWPHVGLPSGACGVLLVLALVGCTTAEERTASAHELVVAIDRTGVAHADSWQQEVAVQTQAALEQAFTDDVDHVALLSIGSNADQTATVAEVDLTAVDGNTEAKRETARRALTEDIASAAAQVAAQPVETAGTDVFAALYQVASLCQAPEVTRCSAVIVSDLEDQRVLAALSPEAAVDELATLMPDLTDISVKVSGLGASGADAATVQKVKAAWTELLNRASAVDVRIARSL
jgi:hypothetical protein